MSTEATGVLIGALTSLLVALISNQYLVRKQRLDNESKERINKMMREDGEGERDANTAKIVGDTMAQVVETLRREITTVHEQLTVANQKIEHLTQLVEEYSRGLDLLIEQIRKDNKIPAYTKKSIHDSKSQ